MGLQDHDDASSKHFSEEGEDDGEVVFSDVGGELTENENNGEDAEWWTRLT